MMVATSTSKSAVNFHDALPQARKQKPPVAHSAAVLPLIEPEALAKSNAKIQSLLNEVLPPDSFSSSEKSLPVAVEQYHCPPQNQVDAGFEFNSPFQWAGEDSSLKKNMLAEQTAFPQKINLKLSQEELFQSYMQGEKNWQTMVDEARYREKRRRSITLNEWGVKKENYESQPDEDVVVRTGTDPSNAPGRGEFSDEDLTAMTMAAWTRIKEKAQAEKLTVDEDQDAGFFRIPELNTIVWKPIKYFAPLLPDAPDFVKYNVTAATHPEVVDPSSAKPKFAMEYIVAMVNKGQVGFCKAVEKWGKGYERYENLIQMAKSTHHAMQKSGLSFREPEKFQRLWELCKMEKSPEELGIFSRGDSEEKILAGLRKEQTLMQGLCRQSFVLAWQELEKEMDSLQKRMEAHKQYHPLKQPSTQKMKESAKLLQDAKDAHLRLDKIATQLKVQMISKDHRKFAHNLFDKDSKKSIEAYLNMDARLQNWTRQLSSFLEAELIASKHHTNAALYYPHWVDPLRVPIESMLPENVEDLTAPSEPLIKVQEPLSTTCKKRHASPPKPKDE